MITDAIKNNPELNRYKWLELKYNKLFILYSIIGLLYLLISSADSSIKLFSSYSLTIFHVLVSMWGSKEVSASVIDEINEKTWDRQRMTGLSPLKLAVGKLLGPALFQWYGALPVLFVFFISSWMDMGFFKALTSTIITLLIAFICNMVALVTSLIGVVSEQASSFSNRKLKSNSFFFVAIALIYFVWSVFGGIGSLLYSNKHSYAGNEDVYAHTEPQASWYFVHINLQVFVIITLLFFGTWLFIAVVQNMRKELQYINGNKRVYQFILFFCVYIFGLAFFKKTDVYDIELMAWTQKDVSLLDNIRLGWFLVSGCLLFISYFLIFTERNSYTQIKKFFRSEDSSLLKPNIHAPNWYIFASCTAVVLLIGIVLSIVFPAYTEPVQPNSSFWRHFDIFYLGSHIVNMPLLLVCLLCLLVRDLCVTRYIWYFTNFNKKPMALSIYFLMMYVLLPILMKQLNATELLLPNVEDIGYTTLISLAIQGIAAVYVLKTAIEKAFDE